MRVGDTVKLKKGDRRWARQYGLAEYYGSLTAEIHLLLDPHNVDAVMLSRPLAGKLFWNKADLEVVPDVNCITTPDGACVGGLMAGKERCMHDGAEGYGLGPRGDE